jgi:hypothetical protein
MECEKPLNKFDEESKKCQSCFNWYECVVIFGGKLKYV